MMKKKISILLIFVFSVIFTAPMFSLSAVRAAAEEAEILDTKGYMEAFFRDGANKQRMTGTSGAEAAAQWIAAEFERLGLEDPVVKTGESDKDYIKSFEIQESASIFNMRPASVTAYNAAGILRVPDKRLKTIVIGSNYDNLYGQQYLQGYTNKSEGALDNASGVCAMLAIAAAVTDNAAKGILPDFNIMFAAFGANNDGFLGSADFVSNPGGYSISLSDIALMVNLSCVAGGDKLYMYCDEVDTLHETHIKSLADSQNNAYGLNLPPKNKKIILDSSSPLQYSHKGLEGDHYYFWANNINTAYFFGYNWDINALGNTESAGGAIAGTESDSLDRLFNEFYKDGAGMADSAVNIIKAVIYDAGTAAALSQSQSEKYDYGAFVANPLYPFIFQIAVIVILCVCFTLLYFNGKKNTPGMIMRKYTTSVNVFGEEYENKKE